MTTPDAIGLIVLGGAIALAAAFFVRPRSMPMALACSALGGVLVGLGGLGVQSDVDVWAWVLTPLLLAVMGVVHLRALFAGAGPLRT